MNENAGARSEYTDDVSSVVRLLMAGSDQYKLGALFEIREWSSSSSQACIDHRRRVVMQLLDVYQHMPTSPVGQAAAAGDSLSF